MEHITSSEMEKYLKSSDEKICVMFVKNNSAPCSAMLKILNEFSKINNNKIFIVNPDKETTDKYGIESVPTCIVFEHGAPVGKRFGTLTLKELDELLR